MSACNTRPTDPFAEPNLLFAHELEVQRLRVLTNETDAEADAVAPLVTFFTVLWEIGAWLRAEQALALTPTHDDGPVVRVESVRHFRDEHLNLIRRWLRRESDDRPQRGPDRRTGKAGSAMGALELDEVVARVLAVLVASPFPIENLKRRVRVAAKWVRLADTRDRARERRAVEWFRLLQGTGNRWSRAAGDGDALDLVTHTPSHYEPETAVDAARERWAREMRRGRLRKIDSAKFWDVAFADAERAAFERWRAGHSANIGTPRAFVRWMFETGSEKWGEIYLDRDVTPMELAIVFVAIGLAAEVRDARVESPQVRLAREADALRKALDREEIDRVSESIESLADLEREDDSSRGRLPQREGLVPVALSL